jgi:hypothetical protein
MTGRGAGICAGNDVPGNMNLSSGRFGRGFGWGQSRRFANRSQRGGGRGWRHQYYATGQPGWMRETKESYPHPTVDPTGSDTSRDTKRDHAEELTSLKEQTLHFKGILKELEGRVNKLQRETVNDSEIQQNEKE